MNKQDYRLLILLIPCYLVLYFLSWGDIIMLRFQLGFWMIVSLIYLFLASELAHNNHRLRLMNIILINELNSKEAKKWKNKTA